MTENIFIRTDSTEGLFINLNNIALIKKEESSQGEWLHVFFNNGKTTTIYNADRELWNALRKGLLNQKEGE